MRNIKLNLQFDGSRYNGWQKLGDSDNTIQGKLETLLGKMTGETISVIGASRTDKGVHAEAFVCNFFTRSTMPLKDVEAYVNQYLPDDIVAYDFEEMGERYHSRYNAKSKEYRYTIDNQPYQNVFTRKYTAHIPETLDLTAMRQAASLLLGTHDFAAFTNMKSKKKSTVRTIHAITITQADDMIYLDFVGDGFLHNMIRIITGTLLRVGKHELEPEALAAILSGKDRSIAGPLAEAKALCLMKVNFK